MFSQVYINIGLVVGGRTTFPDGSVSDKYSKPWGNVEAKVHSDFYHKTKLSNRNRIFETQYH